MIDAPIIALVLSIGLVIGIMYADLFVLGMTSNLVDVNVMPTIHTLDPDSGPVAGNTLVTIYGTNFEQDTIITFGDEVATDVTFVSPQRMTCRSPSSLTTGPCDVKIVRPDEASFTLRDGFEFVA